MSAAMSAMAMRSFGPGTNPLPEQGVVLPHSATGLSGGYQLGYNRQFANRVVLGIEADATFTGPARRPGTRAFAGPFQHHDRLRRHRARPRRLRLRTGSCLT